jgi:hypothetical protein
MESIQAGICPLAALSTFAAGIAQLTTMPSAPTCAQTFCSSSLSLGEEIVSSRFLPW